MAAGRLHDLPSFKLSSDDAQDYEIDQNATGQDPIEYSLDDNGSF